MDSLGLKKDEESRRADREALKMLGDISRILRKNKRKEKSLEEEAAKTSREARRAAQRDLILSLSERMETENLQLEDVIQKIQWTGSNFSEVCEFLTGEKGDYDLMVGVNFTMDKSSSEQGLVLDGPIGKYAPTVGSYIIKLGNGQIYSCSVEAFEEFSKG